MGRSSKVSHKFKFTTNPVLIYTKFLIKWYMIQPLVLSQLKCLQSRPDLLAYQMEYDLRTCFFKRVSYNISIHRNQIKRDKIQFFVLAEIIAETTAPSRFPMQSRYAPPTHTLRSTPPNQRARYAPQSKFSAGSYTFTVDCIFSLFGQMIMHNYI